MYGKKLITIIAAGVIGLAVFGGNGTASAHERHDHERVSLDEISPANGGDKADLCPVTGEKADQKLSYTYEGKVYHFCCASCLVDFRKDPEKYIGKMNSAAAEPMNNEDHDHGHHE